MSGVQTEHIFKGTIETVFKALANYEAYPQYVPYVQKIQVLKPAKKGSACLVRYDLNLIKNFFYSLNMYHEEPTLIRWDLHESDILKTSSGSWELSASGKTKTKALYTVDIEAKLFVPKMMIDKLTKTALPATMDGFQKLVDASKL